MSYKRMQEEEIPPSTVINQIRKMVSFPVQLEQSRPSGGQNHGAQYKKPAFEVTHMPSTFIDMQKSFEYVGDNSTFQKRITTILVIQWISFSFMVNAMAYFFRSPSFSCRLPLTDIYFYCPEFVACAAIRDGGQDLVKMTFDNGSLMTFQQTSIIEEFDLICGREHLAPLAQALFFLGGFISGFIFSYISERIGRRSILLIVQICSITSILICALAPSIEVFLIGYFFIGFSLFGYQTNVYIYIGQISAIRFRTISINMLTMVFVGTPIFLPFLGLIPTWRYAFIFFASLLIVTFPLTYKCFLESPRFLLSKGCYHQARQLFRKISITNHRPPYEFKLLQQIQAENQTYARYDSKNSLAEIIAVNLIPLQKKSYNYLTLFKYVSLRRPTIILMYLWMFRFFMYYGLNLALQSILKSGLLLTIAIAMGAFFEILGTFGVSIMTTFLFHNYKIDIIKFSILLISICMSIMWFLDVKNTNCQNITLFGGQQICVTLLVLIMLVLVVKLFNTVFFSALIVYYSEVFPTPVRALGCGFTLTFGRLGTTLVPFYINYMKTSTTSRIALSFIAPFGFIAFLLCWLMPYTELQGIRQKIKEEEQKQVFQLINMNKDNIARSKGNRTI